MTIIHIWTWLWGVRLITNHFRSRMPTCLKRNSHFAIEIVWKFLADVCIRRNWGAPTAEEWQETGCRVQLWDRYLTTKQDLNKTYKIATWSTEPYLLPIFIPSLYSKFIDNHHTSFKLIACIIGKKRCSRWRPMLAQWLAHRSSVTSTLASTWTGDHKQRPCAVNLRLYSRYRADTLVKLINQPSSRLHRAALSGLLSIRQYCWQQISEFIME